MPSKSHGHADRSHAKKHKGTNNQRTKRHKHTQRFGDEDFVLTEDTFLTQEEIDQASCGEVFQSCFRHSPEEWVKIAVAVVGLFFFLYFFLFSLQILGASSRVVSGCQIGSLLGIDHNPISGVMIGVVATAVMQSSSATTSIVVSLVAAKTVGVGQGIYLIMGANIGTAVRLTPRV
jgi:solute carrier family 34 (sodium-dependent phosphate cotransporter)